MNEEKKENSGWRKNLLSSSLPLEYEASKILVSKGLSVSGEFLYSRRDTPSQEDFSIDIEAGDFTPFQTKRTNPTSRFNLLVECKYRQPGTRWIFLPDANDDDNRISYIGNPFTILDRFSYWHVDQQPIFDLEHEYQMCMRGTEIRNDGSVYEKELRHGLLQLQYGLPPFLSDSIKLHSEERNRLQIPFSYSPILLTNSKIMVLKKDIGLNEVENCRHLNEISDEKDCVLHYLPVSPQFWNHCTWSMNSLLELRGATEIKALDEACKSSKVRDNPNGHPDIYLHRLATGNTTIYKHLFSVCFICTLEYFPKLIDRIKSAQLMAIKDMKRII